MKRVVSLLLCAVLLLGLLPTALAEENSKSPIWAETLDGNGQGRAQELRVMWGGETKFRLYETEDSTEALTGLKETYYAENGTSYDPTTSGGVVTWDAGESCYVLDSSKFTTNRVELHLHDEEGKDYFIFVIVMIEDVGWFWARNPSVASAAAPSAKGSRHITAYYDGTNDVSVYISATHTTAGFIVPDEFETPDGFTFKRLSDYCWRVTCKKDDSFNAETGEKKFEITMQRAWTSILEIGRDYSVTFSSTGSEPRGQDAQAPDILGQLAAFDVTIGQTTKTCYMGVGEYDGNKYNILSTSSTGIQSNDTGEVRLAVGLWWKTGSGDGTYDVTPLTAAEVAQVEDQIDGEFELTAVCERSNSGETLTLESEEVAEEDLVGMPCETIFKLPAKAATWRFTASCAMTDADGSSETYSASGTISCTVTQVIKWNDENDSGSVADIKKRLDDTIGAGRPNVPGDYLLVIRLNETLEEWSDNLAEGENNPYRGQIEIPKPADGVNLTVVIRGSKNGTTLIGGVSSDYAAVSVENIHFVGSGKDANGKISETWLVPDEESDSNPNAGAMNYALYGTSRGSARNCTFTGFYYAIECEEGLRACGENNTFTENNIAWHIGKNHSNGGNFTARNCRFENNKTAIQVEHFDREPSRYAPTGCVFLDNGMDVKNSDRWWFIPGNYFEHDGEPELWSVAQGAGNTYGYPMAQVDADKQIVADTYSYQQLDTENGDTVSNAQTAVYRTPASELDGKTFHVAGTEVTDAETNTQKDVVLASFSFPEKEETAVQTAAIALFAAEAEEDRFDATVDVRRPDASTIEFTMNDPCGKNVAVSVPCTFKDGTVKLGDTALTDVDFDGETVTFRTKQAGTYVITGKTPAQEDPKPDDAITGIISNVVASGALHTGLSASQFTDLVPGSWYYDGVRYALENGLMTGVGARTFAPEGTTTRAMLVTILWRMAGEPYGRVSSFADVQPGSWYDTAVCWAADNGIVTGVTAQTFAPDAPVTREQLCAILARFAAYRGQNTAAADTLSAFSDGSQTADYAKNAVNWALARGIVAGVGADRLAPQDTATRAQLAVMLYRFAKSGN